MPGGTDAVVWPAPGVAFDTGVDVRAVHDAASPAGSPAPRDSTWPPADDMPIVGPSTTAPDASRSVNVSEPLMLGHWSPPSR